MKSMEVLLFNLNGLRALAEFWYEDAADNAVKEENASQ